MNTSPAQPLPEPSAAPVTKQRWLIRLFLLLILAGGGWWGGSFVYHLITPHPTGQILFGCGSHLCLVNADGWGYAQPVPGTDGATSPAWSPDGKRIAFSRNDRLFVMNLDGSGLTQLTDEAIHATTPSWSAKGNRIAFNYSKNDSRNMIAFVSPDGGEVTFLTNSSEMESVRGTQPSWSPDGTQIAFNIYAKTGERDPYDTYDIHANTIYIMNADGANRRRLTNNISRPSVSLSWSPDGTKLVFVYDRPFTKDACVSNSDGSVIDCRGAGGGEAVSVINSDGSGLTPLAEYAESPAWSPDGQYIAYYKSEGVVWCFYFCNESYLWVMRADGSQKTKIVNGSGENPAWRPAP